MSSQSRRTTFSRLPQVLTRFGFSRSTWYAGVKSGKFPRGIKAGPNIRLYPDEDLDELAERLQSQENNFEVLANPVAVPKGKISTTNEIEVTRKSGDDKRDYPLKSKRRTQRHSINRGMKNDNP